MKIIATKARSTRSVLGFGKRVFVAFVSSWLVAAVVTVSAQDTADRFDPQSLIRLEH